MLNPTNRKLPLGLTWRNTTWGVRELASPKGHVVLAVVTHRWWKRWLFGITVHPFGWRFGVALVLGPLALSFHKRPDLNKAVGF